MANDPLTCTCGAAELLQQVEGDRAEAWRLIRDLQGLLNAADDQRPIAGDDDVQRYVAGLRRRNEVSTIAIEGLSDQLKMIQAALRWRYGEDVTTLLREYLAQREERAA